MSDTWPEAQRALFRHRRLARKVFFSRLRVGDVIFAPSGPLQVVDEPVPHPGGRVTVAGVLDYYADGTPFARELAHPPLREVLAARPPAEPGGAAEAPSGVHE